MTGNQNRTFEAKMTGNQNIKFEAGTLDVEDEGQPK